MNAHEFLFGDKFERCIQYIISEAYKTNTREAYQEARTKLAGMRTFIIFLASEGGPSFATGILMLQNESLRLGRAADAAPLPKK